MFESSLACINRVPFHGGHMNVVGRTRSNVGSIILGRAMFHECIRPMEKLSVDHPSLEEERTKDILNIV